MLEECEWTKCEEKVEVVLKENGGEEKWERENERNKRKTSREGRKIKRKGGEEG